MKVQTNIKAGALAAGGGAGGVIQQNLPAGAIQNQ
jgi:hypothetical protein